MIKCNFNLIFLVYCEFEFKFFYYNSLTKAFKKFNFKKDIISIHCICVLLMFILSFISVYKSQLLLCFANKQTVNIYGKYTLQTSSKRMKLLSPKIKQKGKKAM